MALTFREVKGSALTITELDNNFAYFTGSYTNSGSITAAAFSGSLYGTASIAASVTSLTQNVTISGSILVSGSIIPSVPAGSTTSSFSLGSATNAWKDIYVSNGTIYFTNGAGTNQGTLSSTDSGLKLDGDMQVADKYGLVPGYGITVGRGAGNTFSTAVGAAALRYATGNNNTGIGYHALQGTSGSSNTGTGNVAVGGNAIAAITTGTNNAALGYNALTSNTTGYNNVGIGTGALGANTTGLQNIGIGYNALTFNTTGQYNTAMGHQAGNYVSDGVGNVFVGMGAGSNISGSVNYNIAIGYNAGPISQATQQAKLYINNAASDNPLIGGDFSSGVVTINKVMSMVTQSSAPTVVNGGLFVSSSGHLFFGYAGSWMQII